MRAAVTTSVVCGLVFVVLASAPWASADIVTGLEAHWMLDETGGLTAYDASGNGHDATFNPALSVAAMGVAGVVGTAYDFEMDDDFVLDAGTGLQLSSGNAVTVAAFVRPESFRAADPGSANDRQGILGDTASKFIFTLEEAGQLRFTWDPQGAGYQDIMAGAGDAVPQSSFSHVAAVVDNGTATLYVDGQPVATSSVDSGNFEAFGNMQLGRVNSTTNRDFDGRIDDLRVYSRALTPSDIEELASPSGTKVLVVDAGTNRVLRYRVVGSTWTPDGIFAAGTYGGQALDLPWGVAQAPDHRVYIGEERDGGRILRFDQFGGFVGVVATEGVQFTGRPEALTMGPDRNLYFSTAFGAVSDMIYKVDLTTDAVSLFVPTSGAGYTLSNPRGIAFGSDGNLYVASRDNDQILAFDGLTGAFLSVLATPDNPQGLGWDEENGRLLASVFGTVDWFGYTLGGAGTKIYDASVGYTPSFDVINGGIYGTDWNAGSVVRLVDFNNLDTVVSGLTTPGHMLAYTDTPEPGTLALLGMGALALARRRRRRTAA